MRTEWMMSQSSGNGFPPAVPDLRDNRPWLPAGGLENGLFQNFRDTGAETRPDSPEIGNFDQRLQQLAYEEAERERLSQRV